MKTKIENKLYDALLKWVETADSTPSDPDQVKSSPNYTEGSAKNFIEYLEY